MTNITARRKLILAVMDSADNTIFTVEFYKRDGSLRKMQVQRGGIEKLLVGDDASDAAKQAVATRKRNHPELVAVYDLRSKSIRSINLDTVISITLRGIRTEWSLPEVPQQKAA
jgi:hypothetical protein